MAYCCIRQHSNTSQSMWCEQCDSLVAGAVIDDFKVVSYIGSGSFSAVYLAEQQSLNMRKVVIKILQQPWDQLQLEFFQREAALLATLAHPYILPIYGFGVVEQQNKTAFFQTPTSFPYLVLPYAAQGSIAEMFEREGKRPWPLARVVSLTEHVAEALDYAHARGVLHRDIKPANLLQMGSHVLLADFSVASIIDANTSHLNAPWAGSPAYMAPEVWGLVPGRYSDQYSLAVTCFYLLTGEYPWRPNRENNVRGWLHLHRDVAPRPLHALRADLPPSVSLVLQRALAKDPHRRFPTLQAFSAALLAASQEAIPEVMQQPAVNIEEASTLSSSLPLHPRTNGKEWREAIVFNLLLCIALAAEAAWQFGELRAVGNIFLALWPALPVGLWVARMFRSMRSDTVSWSLCRGVLFGVTDVVLSALVCYTWTALALTIPHWGNDWLQAGDGLRILMAQFTALLPEFLKLFVLGSWIAVTGGALTGVFSAQSQRGQPQRFGRPQEFG